MIDFFSDYRDVKVSFRLNTMLRGECLFNCVAGLVLLVGLTVGVATPNWLAEREI